MIAIEIVTAGLICWCKGIPLIMTRSIRHYLSASAVRAIPTNMALGVATAASSTVILRIAAGRRPVGTPAVFVVVIQTGGGVRRLPILVVVGRCSMCDVCDAPVLLLPGHRA